MCCVWEWKWKSALFSATWPTGVRRLAKSYLKDPMMVFVGTLDLMVRFIDGLIFGFFKMTALYVFNAANSLKEIKNCLTFVSME